jgi:transcriptional regulator with XRE-family HTH domain
MGTEAQRERALKLAERLIKVAPETDEGLLLRVRQIVERLGKPMDAILEKVPGDSVVEKCKRIGITRQAYYRWLRGEYRPNLKQSKRLASLTGLDLDEIYWKEVG